MSREDRAFRRQMRGVWQSYERLAADSILKTRQSEDASIAADVSKARRFRARFFTVSPVVSEPNFWERCTDRVRAVSHAILQVDKTFDPILEYEGRLFTRAEIWQRRANSTNNLSSILTDDIANPSDDASEEDRKNRIREDGTEITKADFIRAEIAKLEDKIAKFNIEPPAQSAALKSLEQSAKDAADDAELRYNAYEDFLGRPPFKLDYNELFKRAQGAIPKDGGDASNDAGGSSFRPLRAVKAVSESVYSSGVAFWDWILGIWAGIGKFFKSPMESAFFWIVFPVEILFTLPAFQSMTPDNVPAAYAAAIVFTLVLIGLGAGTFILFRLGFETELFQNINKESPYRPLGSKRTSTSSAPAELRVKPRWHLLVASALVFVLGVTVAFFGADVRGRAPAADLLNRREAVALAISTQKIPSGLTSAQVASIKAQKDDGNVQLQKIKDEQRALIDIKPEDLRISSILQGVSLFIYVGLFLLVIIRLMSESDPLFNYELWARHLQSARSAEWMLKAGREFGESYLKRTQDNERKVLEEALRNQRIALGLFAPDDPKALWPAGSKPGGGKSAAKPDKAADDSKAKKDDPPYVVGHVGILWAKDRLRRYTRTYCYLAGRRLRSRYSDSIDRALQRGAS